MSEESTFGYASAVRDFYDARRRAGIDAVIARLTGKSVDLFSYEDVRHKLKARSGIARGLQDIPLDAIVGSVGRYTDFTRNFLPRRDSDRQRWARVKAKVTDLGGLPPIEVYQIGEAYFVRDGNHRVSVARQLDAPTIQAYVTEMRTKVPLSPDDQLDDLILKAEYVDFLEHTRLDKLRPEADLSVTVPGGHRILAEHIGVHRYFMGQELEREIPYEEAVAHWYDEVYLPVVQVIQDQGILRDFHGRTETDLYLWVSEHRAALEERLGWEVKPEAAANDLATQSSARPQRMVARVSEKILDAVTPDELDAGPAPGKWRQERSTTHQNGPLFANILVPVSGEEQSWYALTQALEIARREGGQLRGLHVVPSADQKESEKPRNAQAEFIRRTEEAGIPAGISIEVGGVARKICERNRWTDLIVVNVSFPPPSETIGRLSSGFRTMILRCASPILAVPRTTSPLDRGLLAYDGSPKADEALFVATYVAAKWGTDLTVVAVVAGERVSSDALTRAKGYLESHGVEATYVKESGPVSEAILKTARDQERNLIIMGGYGHTPVLEVVIGSVVDQVLSESQIPTLICR